MSGDDEEYRVGRGRPPLHSRFQPGRSGNPKGRPKGLKSVEAILRELLGRKITIGTGAASRRVSTLEAMLMQLVRGGLKGNRKAAELLLRLQAAQAALPDQSLLFSSKEDEAILQAFLQKAPGRGDRRE